ncbi:hypothetical protein HDV05_008824, partial [Chytridiales sp. JEL 0842]
MTVAEAAAPTFCKVSLPADVLNLILESLTDPLDRLSFARVSKLYFESAVRFLWRRKCVPADEWDRMKDFFNRPRTLYRDYRIYFQHLQLTPASNTSSHLPEAHASSPHYPTDPRLHGLTKFIKNCPNLTTFASDLPTLNDDDMWILTKSCPLLHTLSICTSANPLGQITDEGIRALTSHCRDLKHLRIKAMGDRGVLMLGHRAFESVAKGFGGGLITFALERVGRRGGDDGGGADLMMLLQQRHQGRTNHTGTTGVNSESEYDKLSSSLRLVISSHSKLKRLSLDWPLAMTEALEEAHASLRDLHTLRVGNFPSMDTIALVVRSNPNLKSLWLSNSMFMASNGTHGQNGGDPTNSIIHSFPVHTPADQTFLVTLQELTLDSVGFLLQIVPLVSRFRNLKVLKLKPP